MAYQYLTANQAYTIAQAPQKLVIQVNTALTGTLTIEDDGTTIAVITNPAAGDRYEYYDLTGEVTITPSASCDVTVSVPSRL